MQVFRSPIALFLIVFLALSLREPARAADIDPALVAAAKKEGRIVLYTPMIVDQIVRPLAAAFQAKYGIGVEYLRMDSAAVVLKVLNEYRARRAGADVISTSLGIESLIASKALRQFKSASAAELPANYKDPNGYWAANRLYVLGPAVNTTLVKQTDWPKTFDDLLDPKWTGKIVWRRNNLTGATGFIGNVLVTMGEEKGMEYLRKLARQRLITLSISDRAVLDQIIAGEYAMTIAMTNHNVEISRKEGAPVAWTPLETAMIFSEQMGLTTLSKRPNAGLLFLEYALSREGQTVFQKAGYIPTYPDVPPLDPKLLPEAGGFKGNVFTPAFVEQNRRRWDGIAEQLFR
jgi:ABC-type Fe3+ transport system substrate-binding protein